MEIPESVFQSISKVNPNKLNLYDCLFSKLDVIDTPGWCAIASRSQIRIRKDKESQSFYGEIGASFSRSIYVIINHTKGFVR